LCIYAQKSLFPISNTECRVIICITLRAIYKRQHAAKRPALRREAEEEDDGEETNEDDRMTLGGEEEKHNVLSC